MLPTVLNNPPLTLTLTSTDLFKRIPKLLDAYHVGRLCQHLGAHQLHKILKVHFTATCRSDKRKAHIYVWLKKAFFNLT